MSIYEKNPYEKTLPYSIINFMQVSKAEVEDYTGESEPPCIVMTLIANANFTVTLDGVQPPNTITITTSPDAANFQMKASTDVANDDRLSTSSANIGITKLYGMKTMKLHICFIYRV